MTINDGDLLLGAESKPNGGLRLRYLPEDNRTELSNLDAGSEFAFQTTDTTDNTLTTLFLSGDGNVGVGSSSTLGTLHVRNSREFLSGDGNTTLRVDADAEGWLPQLYLTDRFEGPIPGRGLHIYYSGPDTESIISHLDPLPDNASALIFRATNENGSTLTHMTMTAGGNLGIGTSSPGEKLQVHNGRVKSSTVFPPSLESNCPSDTTLQGTDTAGVLLIGANNESASCTITFHEDYPADGNKTLSCVASSDAATGNSLRVVIQSSPSELISQITISRTGQNLVSERINYVCVAVEGPAVTPPPTGGRV